MFATGKRKAYIVAYALEEADYDNFFREIDENRLSLIPVEYNEGFVKEIFLPKIRYLSDCLRRGVFPSKLEEA